MAGYAILSDIHGNLYALEAVIKDMADFDIEGVILLGDLIDYGMQSNEVVQYLHDRFRYKICNIWGIMRERLCFQIFSDFLRSEV